MSPIASEVNSRDWNCEGAETRYLTHAIHRYSGKFIPQVARQAIELVSDVGDVIVDPFCGSGTTLLEAGLLGRRAIGLDLSPLAVLISKVKCTRIPSAILSEVLGVLDKTVCEITYNHHQAGSLFAGPTLRQGYDDRILRDPRWTHPWYRKWFDPSGLAQLILLQQEINNIAHESARNMAAVAFSDILRRCSHAHSGYPNVMYDKRRRERAEPAGMFRKRVQEIADAVRQLNALPSYAEASVFRGDAAATALPSESVDAIVTHPPYIGSVPYAEYGLLSLTWMGINAKALDAALTGGKRQATDVLPRFQQSYGAMIGESFRLLRPGGSMFLLVGHPLVRGERVNLTTMTCDFARRAGFILRAHADRFGANRRANKMGSEDVLFFEKLTPYVRSSSRRARAPTKPSLKRIASATCR